MFKTYEPMIGGKHLDIRNNEVICVGTVESVRYLEHILNQNAECTILHDASKGKHLLLGDYTKRVAFSRKMKVDIKGESLCVRLWYDRRVNIAKVCASPSNLTKLRKLVPGFGHSLWQVAKSIDEVKHDESVQVHTGFVPSVAGMATGKARA